MQRHAQQSNPPAANVEHHRETLDAVDLTFLVGTSLGSKVVEILESGQDLPEEDGTALPSAELLLRMFDADRDGLLNDKELTEALRGFAAHLGPGLGATEDELVEVSAALKEQLCQSAGPAGGGVGLAALATWLEGFRDATAPALDASVSRAHTPTPTAPPPPATPVAPPATRSLRSGPGVPAPPTREETLSEDPAGVTLGTSRPWQGGASAGVADAGPVGGTIVEPSL